VFGINDEERALVAPDLPLVMPEAPQRTHKLREGGHAFALDPASRSTGAPWRSLLINVPPWEAICQQARRWLDAGYFAAMVHDLRVLMRSLHGRADTPTGHHS
jgi:transposase